MRRVVYCLIVFSLLPSASGALAQGDPTPTGVSPATVQPGQNIVVTGSALARSGFVAQLRYTRKYVASGEAPTALITATSTSATQLVFPAPTNMLPTGLKLEYRSVTRSSTVSTTTADTGFLLRAPFPVPGRVDVLEKPQILGTDKGVILIQMIGARPLLLPLYNEIRGKHLVPAPNSQVTVTFNGTAVEQAAAPRYEPPSSTSPGVDILKVLLPEPPTTEIGTLKVTTSGGDAVEQNVIRPRRPRVTSVDEINDAGVIVGPAAGRLKRGRRYLIRGTALAHPESPPFVISSRVRLGTTELTSDTTVISTAVTFVVPATFSSSSTLLELQNVGGTATVGTFTVVDGDIRPPGIADVIVAPTPVVGGRSLTAVVSLAGAVTPGVNVGDIEVSGIDFAFSATRFTPITSNPQTIRIGTKVQAVDLTTSLKFRLTRPSGAVDEVSRPVQIKRPRITALTFSSTSVVGGGKIVGSAVFDVDQSGLNSLLGCPVPVSRNTAEATVEISDTSAVRFVDASTGSTSKLCIERDPQMFSLQTVPVSSPRTVTVTLRTDEKSQSVNLTVLPPTITALTIDRASIVSHQAAVGTVTLTSPMPKSFLPLTSSDPALVVPSRVTLSGNVQTTFPISTLPVATTRQATISATLSGTTRSATITLNPLEITALTLSPVTIAAGSNSVGRVTFNAPVTVPVTATLTSSDPTVVTVPSTITLLAGQTAATFSAQSAAPQSATKTVTITASYSVTLPDGSTATTSRSATLSVNP